MDKRIYIFSGLGADERVFQQLDFSGYSPVFVKWILPQVNETIENYALRLRDQIHDERPVLIGLSFGGIMAIEVAKQIETEKVIVISSVKTKHELPFYFSWAGVLGLIKLIPARMFKRSNPLIYWLFGTTSEFENKTLKQIMLETDPVYTRWAVNKILNWKNEIIPENIVHIHGTRDHLLPIQYIKCDRKIDGGGHFMVLSKSEEVTKEIRNCLGN